MPSPQSTALETHYKATVALLTTAPDIDLALRRALLDQIHLVTGEPTDVTYRDTDAGGRPGMWCEPRGADQDGVIVYFHGGGFVVQSIHSHRKLAGHLAKAANRKVLLLDYRQAPEFSYPAPIDDAEATYAWLLDQGVEPAQIAFAGDSAGACLALSTVVRLRDNGIELPAAVLGFSPWLDLESLPGTLDTNEQFDALAKRPLCEEMAAAYIQDTGAAADPRANPLHADLTGFPPVYMTASDIECLFDNGERFAARARQAGVDVTFVVEEGQQHVYQFMAGRAPEADRSIAAAGAWLAARLGASAPVSV
ncbi:MULTISPECIES: alpha/beta hydrolase [unclassified Rhodococcus (in: high G+C Gram-positive bacteria)]|uniref:alpha/beta hydrolase n=1 Tax=unclassified Rhodococcus (in: high G+C Gram-positive bacteria) TaxID=192944 RepID=UPI0009264C14|nr:alpha/beta hydrolase [Rhodococcus sp. M8]OLL20919.1 esterase [Rhodococcus sp. M8]QPG44766.1 alpha/beta hydrolase [Rhodococcus sp. M8]